MFKMSIYRPSFPRRLLLLSFFQTVLSYLMVHRILAAQPAEVVTNAGYIFYEQKRASFSGPKNGRTSPYNNSFQEILLEISIKKFSLQWVIR